MNYCIRLRKVGELQELTAATFKEYYPDWDNKRLL